MKPLGPNEKTMAIEVVNGGETSGSSAAASSRVSQCRPSPARAAVSANRKPRAVPSTPTERGEDQAVDEGGAVAGIGQAVEQRRQREAAVVDEGARQQLGQRIEHEQRRAAARRHDHGDEQRRIAQRPGATAASLRAATVTARAALP